MARRVAPILVLFAALMPTMAQAQVNIDQGKSPAQMFASSCAVCHKSTRGLANGRGTSALASFLTEHYTSSRAEAAALAAYVLAMGGDRGTPAQVRGTKPTAEHPPAPGEDTKRTNRQARHPAKPEHHATAKLQQSNGEQARREEEPSPSGDNVPTGSEPRGAVRHQRGSVTATRGGPKPTEAAPPASAPPAPPAAQSAAAAAMPSTHVPPSASSLPSSQDASPTVSAPPSAAAPPDTQPSEGEPVPRDNIPD